MRRPELHTTLLQMIEALQPPIDNNAVVTTAAELDAAVEVTFAYRAGALVAHAAPPASRFVSGVQNSVHHMRISAALMDARTGDTQ